MILHPYFFQHKDAACQSIGCRGCKRLITKTRKLRNLWLSKRMEAQKLKAALDRINGQYQDLRVMIIKD